jgi:hypothetical protein
VQGRVDALRAVVVGALGPPAPERLADERASYAATLRDLGLDDELPPDEASSLESRAEAVAAALERLP